MPTYQAPGVYVEEVDLTPAITGVGTSTAGFIGVSDGGNMPTGPDGAAYPLAAIEEPQLVTSFDQFKRFFGDFDIGNRVLAHSIYGFFNNGGSICWVARVADLADRVAVGRVLTKFEAIDDIAIVAAPGALTAPVQLALIEHCDNVNLRDRFAILDGQRVTTVTKDEIMGDLVNTSDYAAIYFPHVVVFDPVEGTGIPIPPSGLMAGIYARVDSTRGVHKAPANEVVKGALGLEYPTSKAEQANVNLEGVNVIRTLNGAIRVWGARTLGSSDPQKIPYINVRRLMNYLRESIDEGSQFAVFEPNSNPLWQKINRSVTAFLTRVWRDGALFGLQPEQAFYVRCDESTNPPETRDIGQVIIEIGVAPVKPAEFVVFRIAQFSEIPTT
ncbi:phage tail sheath subtilisin-like domain-containing protein [Streptosporangium soli]|nr:phage tail sheath subtilisin-like domain-containing protein [Streptosporangium sp. KLBMP 9127]